MKKHVVYMLLLFCFISCSPVKEKNFSLTDKSQEKTDIGKIRIDELKTTDEVVEFVKSLNPKFRIEGSGKIQIRETDSIARDLDCNGIFRKWDVKNWEKIDINNDGKTDLIFISYRYGNYSPYVVIDEENNNFKLCNLSISSYEKCQLVKPIKIEGNNQLKIYHSKPVVDNNYNSIPSIIVTDTLTYKFNSFVEINQRKQIHYDVESITIETSGCFGNCPSYDLGIDKQGRASFNGKRDTDYIGKSTKSISNNKFNELVELLEYIRVKDLNDAYEVNWTDDQTSILTIRFSDGSFKKIRDYGLVGTFGLCTVYSKLMKIVTETDWK